jgi:hypothetical protein
MSYRLKKKPLVREVRRVAREQLEGALKEVLTVGQQGRSTAVHEARKHIKKVRALIRLLRPAMGRCFLQAREQRVTQDGTTNFPRSETPTCERRQSRS